MRLKVGIGEEQEETQGVSGEPATAAQEQTGATAEPRRRASAREGRVDARREESTSRVIAAEEAALRRRMGAGGDWMEARARDSEGGQRSGPTQERLD